MKPNVALPGRVFSPIFDPLAAVDYVYMMRAKLIAGGMTVSTSLDFSGLDDLCATLENKGGITEEFSRLFFDITPEQGMWICGRDDAGEVMHVQAMRLDVLTGVDLAQHWDQRLQRIHDGRLGHDHCPAGHEMTGHVVYHGDMWIRLDLRGKGLAGLCSRFAHGLALIKWQPDYIYGFMEAKLALSGFHSREGLVHAQPRALEWTEVPHNIRADDWLVWSNFRDLVYEVRLCGEGFR